MKNHFKFIGLLRKKNKSIHIIRNCRFALKTYTSQQFHIFHNTPFELHWILKGYVKFIMAPKLLTVLLIVVCAFHFIHGKNALFGSKSCTQGPSYWCQSLKTAAECGASYHCMAQVWSKNTHGFCSDAFCGICEKMVGDYLYSAKLQGKLKEFLTNFCGKEPKLLCKACKHIAIHDLLSFINHQLKKISPKDMCKLFDLCSKSLTENELKNRLAPSIIKHALSGHDKIRDNIAPVKAKDLKFKNRINNILSPGAVRNINLHSNLGKAKTEDSTSLRCVVCSFIAGTIDSVLGNKDIEYSVMHEIDHFCTYMPFDMSKECYSLVNKFEPPILQALLQYLSAKDVCSYYVHACSQSKLDHDTTGMRIIAPTQLASGYCVFCEIAVRIIEELLTINKSERYIIGFWNKMCYMVVPTGILRYECQSVLGKLEMIIHQLNNNIAPSKVCQLMRACEKSAMAPKKLDLCRFGPKFWCSSDVTASMCKKQHYCRMEDNVN
ncbi:Prosaposin [Trichoplax sp. H2]|nr:Prosaposin [Trichoplax sp. H2]|eukprot:RDD43135.1 Prosaposin [Trichoplax sp. H2]